MPMRIARLAVCFAVIAAISIPTGTGLAQVPVPRVAGPSPCEPLVLGFSGIAPAAIADGTTITRTAVVGGVGQYLWDVDLRTFITHTYAADLRITLMSPAGTVVTITTDNGFDHDNVFNGTLWDDQAGATNQPGAVTEATFANNVVETPLAPEEALSAFRGENPNGTWTLSITDDGAGDTGTLHQWSLTVASFPEPPLTTQTLATNSADLAIPDNGTISSTITVSGAPNWLTDLNVQTFVAHAVPEHLEITLTSPTGTVVSLTKDNGGANVNVFNGTIWTDQAGATNIPGAVTDTTFATNVVETPLAAQEPLGAFLGEDPNGTWTLSLTDDTAGVAGTLTSWQLHLTTGACGNPPQTFNFGDDDRANAIAIQPDGKVVVAGSFDGGASDFAVLRYNPDRTPDLSFAGTGHLNFSFGNAPISFAKEFATAVALQPDGKIVVAGYTDVVVPPGAGPFNFAIARLNSNGTLDTSFNGTGKVIVDFDFDDRATGVVVQPDGKIVVAGYVDGGGSNFALARLNPNGTLDTSFNSTVPPSLTNGAGRLAFTFGLGTKEFAQGVVLDSLGRIIVVGYTDATGAGANDFAIARVTPTGELDPGFDGDGRFTSDFGFDDRATAVTIQPDDKAVVVGHVDDGAPDFAVLRLTTSGGLDGTFNVIGRKQFTLGANDYAQAIARQSNGKLVIAGYTNTNTFGNPINFAVARLTSGGILDTTFNESGPEPGVQFFDVGADDYARAVAVQGDGVVVAAGFTRFNPLSNGNFAVVHMGGLEPFLTVTNIYPSSGLTTGGTHVTIDGTGFLPDTTVSIGGVPVTNLTVISSTRITAITGAHAAGPVTVTVTSGAPVTVPNGYTYLAPPADQSTDTDGDGIPDAFELQLGLDPLDLNDRNFDWDQDGRTNVQEYLGGSHPRGFYTRYLAEGATGPFFNMQLALLNAGELPAQVLLRFLKSDGTVVPQPVLLNVSTRATVDPETLAPLANAEFSTVVESDEPVVADRTMTWDANGYGSHAETSVASPAVTWYLAEGATHSGFNLFYLLQNPNVTDATVDVKYLLPAPAAPITRSYVVPANSRFNIWVDLIPEIDNTDVSAIVTSTNGLPIIVERAMYLDAQGLLFGAGHESAGVTSPATSWFLAEGATGSFFDLFVLIANPNGTDATVQATYLLPDGSTVVKNYVVTANSRFNIWVDLEAPALANTAVSTTITSSQPVIVERAMWWPGSSATWQEAHNSPGATSTGTLWALAEGDVTTDGRAVETYILLANTSAFAGTARVTLIFEDGTSVARDFGMNPNSRTNVAVGIDFPEAVNRRFGALIQSLGAPPAQIVVERAMYSNATGIVWAAGTNALATKLQ